MVSTTSSQSLQQIVHNRILSSPQQRITFAEYMDLALYSSPYGYYASGTVKIGAQGDFFTSSSLGADFGELLAKQFIEIWEILGQPSPFMLVEMGAGQGLLAADVLNYLSQHAPNLFSNLKYIIVESSAGLASQQQELLQNWLNKGVSITWKSLEELPNNSIVGCCFSNELVDAFPVHFVTIQDEKLAEIYVTTSDTGFKEVTGELSTPRLADYFSLVGVKMPSSAYEEGYRTEVNLAALNWLETLSEKMQRGYLITIDYGYPAWKYYHSQRREGTLKCYYQHRHHDNPYVNLGQQDITAHVDFTALEKQGEQCGLEKVGFTQQGLFLMALGLGDRLSELSSGKFGLQDILSRRSALHQLMNPTGLGGFGVLVQSKGVGETILQGLTIPEIK